MKIGNGSIPLRIGNLINTKVYGGPYRSVPVDYWGVKMAAEITHPHMVSVPTKDFCVPEVSDLKAGIVKALMAMMNEEDVYVGCMGGIGRTGIFLAALAKVQIEYRRTKHRKGRGDDPVSYVREHFIPHAVETKEQEQFIADFDVSDIVSWLDMTQTAMGLGGVTPPKTAQSDTLMFTDDTAAGWVEYGDVDTADIDIPSGDQIELATMVHLDSMQSQLDELDAELAKTQRATAKAFKLVDENIAFYMGLTKPSLVSRIRGIFRK